MGSCCSAEVILYKLPLQIKLNDSTICLDEAPGSLFKLRNVIGRLYDINGEYDIYGRNSIILKNEIDYQNDISMYSAQDGDIVIKVRKDLNLDITGSDDNSRLERTPSFNQIDMVPPDKIFEFGEIKPTKELKRTPTARQRPRSISRDDKDLLFDTPPKVKKMISQESGPSTPQFPELESQKTDGSPPTSAKLPPRHSLSREDIPIIKID